MAGSKQNMRNPIAPSIKKNPSNLHRLRSAVAGSEDEDARLTGMTRSLDRRLLALNLQPMPASANFMKLV